MAVETRPEWLTAIEPAAAAIAALLHPHAEVVVHDVAADRILAVWNAFSGRAPGDPALLELPAHDADAAVLGPYEKVLADGRRLTSVSAVIPGAAGAPAGLLCVNLDRSPLDGAVELLRAFAAPVAARPPALFERDWREQIALAVDAECRERGLRRDRLTREDRRALVAALDGHGLFATRRAADHAARALGVSRATVYALLKEVRT
jgi:predicted transcriptional regulator YheO